MERSCTEVTAVSELLLIPPCHWEMLLTKDWPATDQTSTFEVQVSLWWLHGVCGRPSHECLVTLRSFRLPHHDLRRADAGEPQKCKSWPNRFLTANFVRSVSSESLAPIWLLRWASAQSREPRVSMPWPRPLWPSVVTTRIICFNTPCHWAIWLTRDWPAVDFSDKSKNEMNGVLGHLCADVD